MSELELTPRQQRFCEEYLVDLNGTQAAIRAGYSERTANRQATRLLSKDHVVATVSRLNHDRSEGTQVTAAMVLEALWANHLRAIQAEPLVNKNGDVYGYRWEANASNRALELLGKHLALFNDKLEVTGAGGGPVTHLLAAMTDGEKQRELLRLMPPSTEAA